MKTLVSQRWYVALPAALGIIALLSLVVSRTMFLDPHHGPEAVVSTIALIGAMVLLTLFISHHVSLQSPIPNIVTSGLFGLSMLSVLDPVLRNVFAMSAIANLGANYILFAGGLEIHFHSVKKQMGKILLLATLGAVITATLYSALVHTLAHWLGLPLDPRVSVLLGALLCSTDPAAIVPMLKTVCFPNEAPKEIAIAESAFNDVFGTVLTSIIFAAAKLGAFDSIPAGYLKVLQPASLLLLGKQLLFGLVVGAVGFGLLKFLAWFKRDQADEHGSDTAYLWGVPMATFGAAIPFGGSGYLGSFLAGLRFSPTEQLKHTVHTFDQVLIGISKHIIFLLLGALALMQGSKMMEYAPIGLLSGLSFIFIVRPVTVVVVYGMYALLTRQPINWKEVLFLSWVRMTGAIPAVLVISIMADTSQRSWTGPLGPIAIWVIAVTLLIQPATIGWWAKKVGVAIDTSPTRTVEA